MKKRKPAFVLFHYLIASLSLLSLMFCTQMAQGAAEKDTGLSQLIDPRGLEDPFYRWNAKVVQIQGNPVASDFEANDYAAEFHGDTWDFNEGDTEGIACFSDGIKGVKVIDGNLTFTTGDQSYFYWGSHLEGDTVKGENIGSDWPSDKAYQWHVAIRLKQSKEESQWVVSARRRGASPLDRNKKMDQQTKKVTGKEWQVIEFPFSAFLYSAGGYKFCGEYQSLHIEPGEKGNNVEIDWIKVRRPRVTGCIRKTIVMEDDVQKADFCLFQRPYHDEYEFFINGRKVVEAQDKTYAPVVENIDCGKYFHKGENVIAYRNYRNEVRGVNRDIFIEGVVHYKNGNFARIYTDGSWKGRWGEEKGWANVSFDDSGWKNVKATVDVAKKYYQGGSILDPPYMGPIGVEFPNKRAGDDTPPIFKQKEGVFLRVNLPKKKEADYSLTYSLIDAFDRKNVVNGRLEKGKSAEAYYIYPFRAKPEKPGVYDLVLRAEENGRLLDTRFIELAVVGKIAQREVPLDRVKEETKKTLVDEINCGDPDDPHPFLDGFRKPGKTGQCSRIEEVNDIRYRETANGKMDWFSYQFEIKNIYKPHLVVVHYLNDRKQAMYASVTEESRKYYNCGDIGMARAGCMAMTGGPLYPITGKVETMQFMYYPKYTTATVDIFNWIHGERSAVTKICIYEMLDLPAVKVPHEEKGRLFGDHTERARILTRCFYAGTEGDRFRYDYGLERHRHHGFLRNWYTTISNQIKHMRFRGQNAFFCGFWMYSKAFYPTRLVFTATVATYDNFALMFSMFEANDLYLIPCVEFNTSRLLCRKNRVTDSEVRAGEETIMVVDKNGRQANAVAIWGKFNVFHPVVKNEIKSIVNEIVTRYSDSKAFKGIAFVPGCMWEPVLWNKFNMPYDNYLGAGYEDFSIELFEQKTGIQIPVAKSDPERFGKRYEWLTQNKKDEWIDFRCKELFNVNEMIRSEIRRKNPDHKYYLFQADLNVKAMWNELFSGKRSLRDLFRITGFDPELYKGRNGIELGRHYMLEPVNYDSRQVSPGVLKTLNILPELCQLFDNGVHTASLLDTNWAHAQVKQQKDKNWLWKRTTIRVARWMGYPYFFDRLSSRLTQMTPSTIVFVFKDIHLHMGQHDLLRQFAVPFRSIPLGRYETLTGAGLDANIVVREMIKDGTRYFYVVNPFWWEVEAQLQLSDSTEVLDRVDDKQLKTTGKTLPLSLRGYEVKVFEMPERVRLVSAQTEVPPRIQEMFGRDYELLDYMDKIRRNPLEKIKNFGFPENCEKTMLRIKSAKKAYTEKNYSEMRRLMEHPFMIKLISFLKKNNTRRIDDTGQINERKQPAELSVYQEGSTYTVLHPSGWILEVPQMFYGMYAGKKKPIHYTSTSLCYKGKCTAFNYCKHRLGTTAELRDGIWKAEKKFEFFFADNLIPFSKTHSVTDTPEDTITFSFTVPEALETVKSDFRLIHSVMLNTDMGECRYTTADGRTGKFSDLKQMLDNGLRAPADKNKPTFIFQLSTGEKFLFYMPPGTYCKLSPQPDQKQKQFANLIMYPRIDMNKVETGEKISWQYRIVFKEKDKKNEPRNVIPVTGRF